MDYQKKDVMTAKTSAQAADQNKEREITKMEVMGEMAETKELEERLHRFVGWEELYSGDLCTDELIERLCQFFGKLLIKREGR